MKKKRAPQTSIFHIKKTQMSSTDPKSLTKSLFFNCFGSVSERQDFFLKIHCLSKWDRQISKEFFAPQHYQRVLLFFMMIFWGLYLGEGKLCPKNISEREGKKLSFFKNQLDIPEKPTKPNVLQWFLMDIWEGDFFFWYFVL